MPEAPDRTLFRLIESQVERTPDALALLAPSRAPLAYAIVAALPRGAVGRLRRARMAETLV